MPEVLAERRASFVDVRLQVGRHALVFEGMLLFQHDDAPASGGVGSQPARRAFFLVERVLADNQYLAALGQRGQVFQGRERDLFSSEGRLCRSMRVEE